MALVWTNTPRSTGPGGKIKMSLGMRDSQGKKRLGGANVKPRPGLAGRVLFKAKCQEGPINPHRVRDAKSRNITPV